MSGSPADSPSLQERIVAVVVTYNRRQLLEKTLAGIAAGDLTPQQVVVVDNASTDDTLAYLTSLDYPLPLDLVQLPQNVGGAGGFAVGIDRALARHGADLVWIMDDDTEPTANTLEGAWQAWRDYDALPSGRPAFVASRVLWDNGQDHPMNTMRTMFRAGADRTARAAAVGARPIRSASFVSILLDAAALRATELPLADFFIWNDDFEYTTRLAHHSRAIATDRSVALHHTKTFGTTDAAPGPRFYNDVRNKLWVFCARRTLSPLEKFLYGGSTARLWASTLLKTQDKTTYLGYFLKGVRDAAGGYRPNEQVLQGVYELEQPQMAQRVRSAYSQSQDFSLLMSVYGQDNPDHLLAALRSNIQEQTLAPSQLVLVEDGPLPASLSQVLEDYLTSCPIPVKRVQLETNRGLAVALRQGLAACDYDLVARADADDISLPQRFEEQIPLLGSGQIDVLGAAMNEFSSDPAQVEATRQVASEPRKIAQLLPSRNPLLHPTVVFRKSAVEAVGSYVELPGAEDYWLWVRMSRAGFILQNLPQPLVAYRAQAAYAKRAGWAAYQQDYQIQRRLYTGGLLTKRQWAQNMDLRSVYRFTPQSLRTLAFRAMTDRSQA